MAALRKPTSEKNKQELKRIKKLVDDAREYFHDNYKRFHESNKFVFKTAINDAQLAILKTRGLPNLEFNYAEAFISRLLGEFAKQEPSIEVRPANDVVIDPMVIDVVEGHIRHSLDEANNNCAQYDLYQDQLGGGFSCWKLWTEYANEMAFEQDIKVDRVYDPTLVGFSPLARRRTKSDSTFCYEMYPMTKEEFEDEFPGVDLTGIKFIRENSGYNWSYNSESLDILLVCDFYEKTKKKTKIVSLSPLWFNSPDAANSGFTKVMTLADYKDALAKHEQMGRIAQPPKVIQERMTDIITIARTRFIENQILDNDETDFKDLPHIFVDGNSRLIKDSDGGNTKQMTRPYAYQTEGLQRLKNAAGQTLAYYMDNMCASKWLVPDQALPDQGPYLDAWTNQQIASLLVHKTFVNNNPEMPIPPPREVNNVPCPPEVINTFVACDQMFQMVLGSYDSAMGVNDNQLSGEAIIQSATQGNSASMPYIVGHLQALNQLAQIQLNLIPKYYKTPRTIPIIGKDGKRQYIKINQPGGVTLDYSDNDLQVSVTAGVNFSVQKTQALRQIISMMQASQLFAQFMNTKGLTILLDNMEIRGIDQLKILADEFKEEMDEAQKQSKNQPNPIEMKMQIEQQKLQQDAQSDQTQASIDMAKVSIAKQDSDTNRMKVMLDAKQAGFENMVQLEKAQTEKTVHVMDLAMKEMEHGHKVNMDHAEHTHKQTMDHHKALLDTAALENTISSSNNQPDEGGDNE